jgi:glucosamine kinase
MVIIADSGSTKTEWRLVAEDGKRSMRITSEGLNPFFLTKDEIASIIRNKVLPETSDVDSVYFYGAGCGSRLKAREVKDAIDEVIPSRRGAEVAGDTLAAARSVFQNHAGIICILGTGSNSCVYDGKEISGNVPSLGYMFSDWGSGTVIGRDFLSLLLREKLPDHIAKDFAETFALDRLKILENIYNKPMANRFMASFTPFIFKYAEEEVIQEIITENFRNFFSYYVLKYAQFQTIRKVGIVGSIGYHFSKYLLKVAGELDIPVDRIVKNPMDGLVQFHCSSIPA